MPAPEHPLEWAFYTPQQQDDVVQQVIAPDNSCVDSSVALEMLHPDTCESIEDWHGGFPPNAQN